MEEISFQTYIVLQLQKGEKVEDDGEKLRGDFCVMFSFGLSCVIIVSLLNLALKEAKTRLKR